MVSILNRLVGKIKHTSRKALRQTRLRLAMRHLSGPRILSVGAHDVTAIILIRDAEYFLPELLDHHRAVGIVHFVFIDTGSEDRTREILATQPDCTTLECLLPVGEYENMMRAHAAKAFCNGHWCLFVDGDEMIDFPCELSASDFAAYLESRGYNGVMGVMLDLFPPGDLADYSELDYASAIASFDRYDLRGITSLPYFLLRTKVWHTF
jgi:hypothetical protein